MQRPERREHLDTFLFFTPERWDDNSLLTMCLKTFNDVAAQCRVRPHFHERRTSIPDDDVDCLRKSYGLPNVGPPVFGAKLVSFDLFASHGGIHRFLGLLGYNIFQAV